MLCPAGTHMPLPPHTHAPHHLSHTLPSPLTHMPLTTSPTPSPPPSHALRPCLQLVPIYSVAEPEDYLIRGYTRCDAYQRRLDQWYDSAEFTIRAADSEATRWGEGWGGRGGNGATCQGSQQGCCGQLGWGVRACGVPGSYYKVACHSACSGAACQPPPSAASATAFFVCPTSPTTCTSPPHYNALLSGACLRPPAGLPPPPPCPGSPPPWRRSGTCMTHSACGPRTGRASRLRPTSAGTT